MTILAASFFLSRPEVAVTDLRAPSLERSPGIAWKGVAAMGQLVEFPLESGGSVLVDVTGHHTGPVTRSLKGTEVVERARQTFEEAVGRVRPAVEGVIAQLRSLAEAPDEVHVEFGLDLHAEAGAVIAAVGTTANFTVAVTWRRGLVSAQRQPGGNVSTAGGHGTR